jgi:hypothetical protein
MSPLIPIIDPTQTPRHEPFGLFRWREKRGGGRHAK